MASQIQGFLPYHTFLSLSSQTNLAIIMGKVGLKAPVWYLHLRFERYEIHL